MALTLKDLVWSDEQKKNTTYPKSDKDVRFKICKENAWNNLEWDGRNHTDVK